MKTSRNMPGLTARGRLRSDAKVINAPPHLANDMYQAMLGAPWWAVLLGLGFMYLVTNAFFALVYVTVGGVTGVESGDFWEAFFFSVQTLGVGGNDAVRAVSPAAHAIVTLEAFTGLIVAGVITGLMFAKFSMPQGRVLFTSVVTVAPVNGVPTLMFRVANERNNLVIEPRVRVVFIRIEKTLEGIVLNRMADLTLQRDSVPVLTRSWTIMHAITAESPLYGQTPASLVDQQARLVVTLVGLDGTSSQTIYAGWTYPADAFVFGARHVDMMATVGGRSHVDFALFDRTAPTERAEGFPYPEDDRKAA